MIQNHSKGDIGEISDGYHTFNELYFHRMILFSIVLSSFPERAWRSKLHDDGTMYDNYFIVGVDTPEGQYSYHYHMEFWDHFKDTKEVLKAPKWDGHQPKDITRLFGLLKNSEEEENTVVKDIEKNTQIQDLGSYI